MSQNDWWNRLAGPLPDDGSIKRIPGELFNLIFVDLALGGGSAISLGQAKVMMNVALGTDESDEVDDFTFSLATVESVEAPSFPLGTEGVRANIVGLARAIALGAILEQPVPGNPYQNGDDLRIRVGEIILQAGGSLVGSMAEPPVPDPEPEPPPEPPPLPPDP